MAFKTPPSPPPRFPEAIGRVVSLTCPCGWEASYVLPEESNLFLLRVFEHIRDNHGVVIPAMKMEHH